MKNENIVHVVEEYDIPRYEMRVRDDCSDECEMAMEDIKYCCKIWVKSRDYSNLTNVEGDFDDLAGFQSAIGYEIYDNLIDDYVDSICDYDYKNIKEWKEEARSKYNIK